MNEHCVMSERDRGKGDMTCDISCQRNSCSHAKEQFLVYTAELLIEYGLNMEVKQQLVNNSTVFFIKMQTWSKVSVQSSMEISY